MSCRIWFNNSMLYMLLISLGFCWINTQTIWTLIIIIQAIFNVQCPFLTVSTLDSWFQSNSTSLNLVYADQMNFELHIFCCVIRSCSLWLCSFEILYKMRFYFESFLWSAYICMSFVVTVAVNVAVYFFFAMSSLTTWFVSLWFDRFTAVDRFDITQACASTSILIFHKIIRIIYRWR